MHECSLILLASLSFSLHINAGNIDTRYVVRIEIEGMSEMSNGASTTEITLMGTTFISSNGFATFSHIPFDETSSSTLRFAEVLIKWDFQGVQWHEYFPLLLGDEPVIFGRVSLTSLMMRHMNNRTKPKDSGNQISKNYFISNVTGKKRHSYDLIDPKSIVAAIIIFISLISFIGLSLEESNHSKESKVFGQGSDFSSREITRRQSQLSEDSIIFNPQARSQDLIQRQQESNGSKLSVENTIHYGVCMNADSFETVQIEEMCKVDTESSGIHSRSRKEIIWEKFLRHTNRVHEKNSAPMVTFMMTH
eukprot:jgi/Bigna1/88742/estExt_fgenesh1_pg.C_370088